MPRKNNRRPAEGKRPASLHGRRRDKQVRNQRTQIAHRRSR